MANTGFRCGLGTTHIFSAIIGAGNLNCIPILALILRVTAIRVLTPQ